MSNTVPWHFMKLFCKLCSATVANLVDRVAWLILIFFVWKVLWDLHGFSVAVNLNVLADVPGVAELSPRLLDFAVRFKSEFWRDSPLNSTLRRTVVISAWFWHWAQRSQDRLAIVYHVFVVILIKICVNVLFNLLHDLNAILQFLALSRSWKCSWVLLTDVINIRHLSLVLKCHHCKLTHSRRFTWDSGRVNSIVQIAVV